MAHRALKAHTFPEASSAYPGWATASESTAATNIKPLRHYGTD